jgi:hypothetical protein
MAAGPGSFQLPAGGGLLAAGTARGRAPLYRLNQYTRA